MSDKPQAQESELGKLYREIFNETGAGQSEAEMADRIRLFVMRSSLTILNLGFDRSALKHRVEQLEGLK